MQTINPGNFVRLKQRNGSQRFKLIVDKKGIRLRQARFLEALGARLGAHLSHTIADGECVRILGLEFRLIDGASDEVPELKRVEDLQ